MRLTQEASSKLRDYIREACGIDVPPEKNYLIESRLGPIVQAQRLGTFEDLHAALVAAPQSTESSQLKNQVLSAITTNETYFFRDPKSFETIANHILPALYHARSSLPGSPPIRILSAASSTGQEPCSIAMLIHEWCDKQPPSVSPNQFEIVALDISSNSTDKAKSGRYSESDVSRGLKPERLHRFFTLDENGDRLNKYLIKPDVRRMVSYHRLNLLEPIAHLGKFDFVLLRNVLIYFKDETKKHILRKIHGLLNDGGYLLLGGTESIFEMTLGYEQQRHIDRALYKKARR